MLFLVKTKVQLLKKKTFKDFAHKHYSSIGLSLSRMSVASSVLETFDKLYTIHITRLLNTKQRFSCASSNKQCIQDLFLMKMFSATDLIVSKGQLTVLARVTDAKIPMIIL